MDQDGLIDDRQMSTDTTIVGNVNLSILFFLLNRSTARMVYWILS